MTLTDDYCLSAGECGSLTEENGTISSPLYPNKYPHNTNCTWNITVTPGLVIHLIFVSFTLETSSNCKYDYLEVTGSIVRKNGGPIEK